MIQKSDKKADRSHRAVPFWLIAGLIFLCLGSVVTADTAVTPTMQFRKMEVISPVFSGYVFDPGFTIRCGDPLTIDPQVNTPQVRPGMPASVTFIVRNSTGFSVPSADVSVTSSGGTLTRPTGKTDSAGRMSTSFSSPQIGIFFVNVTVSSGICLASSYTMVIVDSEPPAAQISATPPSPAGPAPLTVLFDASGSSGADGATITGWSWKFSDGGTGNTKTVSHTYAKDGTFTATLVVTDNRGKKSPQVTAGYIISPKQPLSVVITTDQASVEQNQTVILAIKVSSKDGKPVPNASVTLNSTAAGSISPLTNKTDSSGMVLFRFQGVTEGNATVTALADNPAYLQGAHQLTIRVTPAQSVIFVPLALIAGILIVILLVAIVLLYLWTRSRFQLKPKLKEIPADGRSATQVRVQFVNGFGSTKKQRSDREIHMEATAGKIQDVVIPAGKEYIDATLTASKECGLVLVTATAENKAKATAEVRFTGEEAGVDVEITPAEIPADGNSTATIILKVKDHSGMYLTYLDEKVIGLTTTLGTVPAMVKIEPRAASGTAIITSGMNKGTALVRARTGSIAGEGRVQFKELGKRYCMHCGMQMEMEAPSCPNCGKIPPSGVDTKQCSTCNAVLPQPAAFCDKCGARQPQ
jgi:PKD repeat protein